MCDGKIKALSSVSLSTRVCCTVRNRGSRDWSIIYYAYWFDWLIHTTGSVKYLRIVFATDGSSVSF